METLTSKVAALSEKYNETMLVKTNLIDNKTVTIGD